MSRLSMNEMTTYKWSFEQDVENYHAAGFDAIGVWRRKLSDFGIEKGLELLERTGLKVSNLLWAGGFTGSEGQSYPQCLADGMRALRLAGQIKADCLVVYSGSRNGHTQNHARRIFCDALKQMAPLAAELDVRLAIEPMHPGCATDWTFLTTLDETIELIEQIGHSHIKLAFDTYHMGHDRAIIEHLASLVKYIGIVHLGDSCRLPDFEQDRAQLGDGALPLRDIVQALDQAGYQGFYDVELMGREIEMTCYREILHRSKQSFEQLLV